MSSAFFQLALLPRAARSSKVEKFAAAALPHLAPLAPVPIGIHPENISENPDNNAAYVADELNLFTITARFAQLFPSSLNDTFIQNAVASIKAPVKIVCGRLDKLVDVQKVKDVFPFFASEDKSLSFIEEAGHEIFNEKPVARAQAVEHLLSWIEEYSPKS